MQNSSNRKKSSNNKSRQKYIPDNKINKKQPRNDLSKQSIKKFKLQIDHQIAKCLDTIDRQGLKYLRQTLKASKIFNQLNSQQIQENIQTWNSLQNTLNITQDKNVNQFKESGSNFNQKNVITQKLKDKQQNKAFVAKQDQCKSAIKKKQQTKKSKIQINKQQKETKFINQKKDNRKQQLPKLKKVIIQNKKTHQKFGLGDKISKRMEQMNIKTGKKIDQSQKQEKSKQVQQTSQMIQQQIIETVQEEYSQKNQVQQTLLQHKHIDHEPEMYQNNKQHKFRQKDEEQLKLIKPSFRIQKSRNQKTDSFVLSQKKQNIRLLDQQIPLQIQEEDLTKKQADKFNRNQTEMQQFHNSDKNQIQVILQKISHLSPTKFHQLQKILDQMENASSESQQPIFRQNFSQNPRNNYQSRITTVSQLLKQQNYLNDQTDEKEQKSNKKNALSSIIDEAKEYSHKNQRDSFKKKEKKDKASSIFLNNSKSKSRIKVENQSNLKSNNIKEENIEIPYGQNGFQSKSLKTQNIKPSRILTEQKKLQFQVKQSPNTKQYYLSENNQTKSKLYIKQQVKEAIQNKSQQKMLKISKKQKSTNQGHLITFRVLSNYGHPSLFGLTGIQLYLINGQTVQISQAQLSKNNNSKMGILFNKINFTIQQKNMFISTLQKPQIILQNIFGNIGGVIIYNYNKSSLESIKEVDQMEIQIDGAKIWKGKVNKGSYNQYQDFGTKIYIYDSFIFPEKVQKTRQSKQVLKNQIVIQKRQEQSCDWLQKGQLQAKMKQIQKQQRQFQIKNKSFKNESIRNSLTNLRNKSKNYQMLLQSLKVDDKNKTNKQQSQFSRPPISFIEKNQKKDDFQSQKNNNNNDILANLQQFKSKPKIRQLSSQNINLSKKVNQIQKRQKQTSRQKAKISKTSEVQDFDQLLVDLQPNIKKNQSKQKIYQNRLEKIQSKIPCQDDLMNDSLFQQKPKRILSAKKKIERKIEKQELNQNYDKITQVLPEQRQQNNFNKKKLNNQLLDDIIGQLNGAIANCAICIQKPFTIPSLPCGKSIQIQFYSNWGHQNQIGINGIQFFDVQGNNVKPESVICQKSNQNLMPKLVKKVFLSSDQKRQFKMNFQKNKTFKIQFRFPKQINFSLFRIWNYNGHRVHSNIGLKFCVIKIDSKNVFMGDIQKSECNPENCYKYCSMILFTESYQILKLINKKDWLTQIRRKRAQQKKMFRSTLQSFNRPKTRNNQNKSPEKIFTKKVNSSQRQIKLPKRNCWQYDPPQLPSCFSVKLILHNTWGDCNFIGLNGIQLFNQKGIRIQKQNISSIKSYPSSTGQVNDKRVVQNLVNGINNSSSDSNIWLSAFQSDIQKLQFGRANLILVQFYKSTILSAINIYNYSKTVERGVRQIQIDLDGFLAFRGYVRKIDAESQDVSHTTINFTNDIGILKKVNYNGYNEDTLEQEVRLINQKKIVK